MRQPQILLDRIHFKSTTGPPGRRGALPTQSYTITFSAEDTSGPFSIPDNKLVPFVGETRTHGYTYGDVYDFFSFLKTQTTDTGTVRTPLVTTLSLLFGLPLPLTTPVYQEGSNFYRLSLERNGANWRIVQKKVDESGNVFVDFDGREVVRILNHHNRDALLDVCERYVNVDKDEIPNHDYMQILQVTGRPWRFCDYWGQPWKIVRTATGDYRWLARPGSQGII